VLGRSFRIALLLFQMVWLNVIVPGHQRGVVVLGGERCPNCSAAEPPCCATKTSHQNDPHRKPDAAHCAICYFSARLTLPPVYDFGLSPLEELDRVAPPLAERQTTQYFLTTYLGRAPPISA
jgi:hypothetical protein